MQYYIQYRLTARDPRFSDVCQYVFATYEEANAARLFVRRYGVYLEDVAPALCVIEYREVGTDTWRPMPSREGIVWADELSREYLAQLAARFN